MVETRKKRGGFCFRNRNGRKNYSGGGLGSSYSFGQEMLARGYPSVDSFSSCGAVARSGTLTTAEISGMKGGLPGLTGGSRKRRAQRKQSKKSCKGSRKYKMRGGRYETVFSGAEYDALGPRGGMLATAGRIACETGVAPHVSPTQSTAPAVAMQGGGALQLAPTPFLQEQTAGYTHEASKFLDSVGAPIMLNTPVGGRMGTPACSQTGGAHHELDRSDLQFIENFKRQPVVPPRLDKYTKKRITEIIKKYKDANEETKDLVGSLLIYPVTTQLKSTTRRTIKKKYSKKPKAHVSMSPPRAVAVESESDSSHRSSRPRAHAVYNNRGFSNSESNRSSASSRRRAAKSASASNSSRSSASSGPRRTKSSGGYRRKTQRKTQRKHRKH